MRKLVWLAVAWIGWLGAGCGGKPADDSPRIWRFAIEETRGSVQDAYALAFKRKVEARTHGAIQVVVYPYGALGTSDHILEQVYNGTLQLAMSSPGHLGKLIPAVQVFLLHYVLSDREDVNACALADRDVLVRLQELYAGKRLGFLDAFSEGRMAWTTRKPVRSPADFAGMKFRVMTSPLLVEAYAAYGASPTPLPYAEVYSALQLRMIDGQVNPVFAIQEMSFHEVTDWLTFPNHASFITTVVANPGFLAALDPREREMVEQVVGELHHEIDLVQRALNDERLARIRNARPEMRVVELSADERAAFAARAEDVRSRFVALAGTAGTQLLTSLETAVARCRARQSD